MLHRFSLAGAALVALSLSTTTALADEDVSIVVDPRTGVASLRNDTSAAIALDGYLLRAGSTVFSPTAWTSLEEQGLSGWVDGPALGNRLADTNLTGSLTLAAGASLAIGSPYLPQTPTAIGQPEPNFDFTYSVAGAGVFTGDVEFSRRNNVVLVVDPATGEATLENQSPFTIQIDGYLIRSSAGVLSTTGWTPLQTGLGPAGGWVRAAGAANRLAEGNLLGSTVLAANGGSLALGAPVNAGLLADETDLTLEFNIPGVGNLAGSVLFAQSAIELLPGDFDGNGSVGNGDLTLLLSNWSRDVPPIPSGWLGSLPTAPGVGNDELTALLSTWGQSQVEAFAVPEPSSALLALLGLCLATRRRIADIG